MHKNIMIMETILMETTLLIMEALVLMNLMKINYAMQPTDSWRQHLILLKNKAKSGNNGSIVNCKIMELLPKRRHIIRLWNSLQSTGLY